jgi:hypothetical protein
VIFLRIVKKLFQIIILLQISACQSGHYTHNQDKADNVDVEDFRTNGASDDQVIQAAIDAAGESGVVQLKNGRTYLIENGIIVKKFQTIEGNNATLKRADETFTTLAKPSTYSSDAIEVTQIPSGWKPGDQVQVMTDSTSGNSNGYADLKITPNLIIGIRDRVITLSSPLGKSLNNLITEWPKGTIVRKVFTLLKGDSIQFISTPFTVRDINFDGNKSNNYLNYYWNVNATIFVRGMGAKIENCQFYNIPDENIVGHGIYISNCRAYNLNGSFVHLSGIDTIRKYPQRNSYIIGNYIEKVCLVPNVITGHSEGAITTSFNGGFATIMGNRVYHCGEAAIGRIEYFVDTADRGKSDLIITSNFFEDCNGIVYEIAPVPKDAHASENILISGNIFSNCKMNDWRKYREYFYRYKGLKVGDNDLTEGTQWILPN